MTWKQEIVRALLLTFGTGQIISNSTYLIKKDGIRLARKQHKEIPGNASDKEMMMKVIGMLLVGIIFFIVSLISYVSHSYFSLVMLISLILFSIYAMLEALYYRYWKTVGFAVVTIILLNVYIFI